MHAASPSDTRRRPRALVTGLTGFTGRYVGKELEAAGYEVVGLSDAPGQGSGSDIREHAATIEAVAALCPDVVIHLAAISFVAHGDADAIYGTNVVGTRNLLEGLASADRAPRLVILASSANIYGNASAEPITEDASPAPTNDYAVSKLAMEYMARTWQERLPLVITRPFNYTGVGQGGRFLLPKIVEHFRAGAEEIELGNIKVWRDFMDVRDVARAYARLVDATPSDGVFNICTGKVHSLEEVIHKMERIAGRRIKVRVNPEFVRANEVNRLVGSNQRLADVIGDVQTIDLDQTLRWMFEA